MAKPRPAARSAIAAQTQQLGGADIGPAVKLPLVVSGLETAFSAGRPYSAELGSLRVALLEERRDVADIPQEPARIAAYREHINHTATVATRIRAQLALTLNSTPRT